MISIALIPNAIAQSEDSAPSYRGAIYPADLISPLAEPPVNHNEIEQTRKTVTEPELVAAPARPVAIRTPSPSLEPIAANSPLGRALGPAAYMVSNVGNREAFRAHIRDAIGRHPSYHSQVARLDEGAAGKRRARAALYPQLTTTFNGDYVLSRDFDNDTDNVVESLRPREQFTAGLSASQLIFDGGATFQRIKSARARQSEFEHAISARINNLAFEVLTAYHDLLAHQALLALGNAVVERHNKILNDVAERERLGAGSQADVIRARARLAAVRARVSEIRESARLAEIRYTDLFDEPAAALSRPNIFNLVVDSREEATAAALQNNPELAAATARSRASTADYKATKSERLPEVRVSVDAVKFDLFNGGDDYDVRAGLDLQYDIFNGGLRGANIAEAGAQARQERFNLEQIRREIARDAAFAFERSQGASERLSALEEAVIAHDLTRDLMLERYRVARGDLIDVLQAENDYFEAAASYVSGLASRDLAAYALMEHTGDLIRFFSPQGAVSADEGESRQ